MTYTKRYPDTPSGIKDAAEMLVTGGTVAFPTETVFGLGADAQKADAVAKIFAAKGRPSFNPLIVHVRNGDHASEFVDINAMARVLIDSFWPGPLTLVLPLRPDSGIAHNVTAGLKTLAVRAPKTQLAQDLLAEFGGPIAAPSANPSGKISATSTDHVINGLDGKIDGIVMGGDCTEGLESTILGVTSELVLLRPGTISAQDIQSATGKPVVQRDQREAINAPGQLASHYAPNASVRLNSTSAQAGEFMIGFGAIDGDINLSPQGDLKEAAENLFAMLHIANQSGKRIAIAPVPIDGIGTAIHDRLSRAAADRT